MFQKCFAFISCLFMLGVVAFGQDAAKAPKEKIERAFAFTLGDDGGYLGVQTAEVTKENLGKYNLSAVRGVAVEKVLENSPAANSGLQAGDVILRFEGEEVTSVRKLTRLIGEVAPDHSVRMTISRNGSEQEISATLSKRPMPKFADGTFDLKAMPPMKEFERMKELPAIAALPDGQLPKVFGLPDGKSFAWTIGSGRQIGISVYPMTKQLGERFGVESGVMISTVRDDSPAAKAGLKAGDIIVEAEGRSVSNNLDLIRAIQTKKEGDVSITFVRDGRRQTVLVTPEASKDNGFVFETDGESGLMPSSPKALTAIPAMPAMPAMPIAAPRPMSLARPARIL